MGLNAAKHNNIILIFFENKFFRIWNKGYNNALPSMVDTSRAAITSLDINDLNKLINNGYPKENGPSHG
jgi:hypothetical protein